MAAATETGRHLGKAALLERVSGGAGHGWARLVVNFDPFVMEFSTAHARDDFIAWSERWCDSGETDFRRPAEACDGPSGATFPVIGPNEFGVPPGQDPGLVYWCYLKSVIDAG